jgi:ketosteroid isomerase-like protein
MRRTAAILLVAFACKPAAPADNTAAARAAIDAANTSWARLSAAGHADSLADLYHANAVLLPPDMKALSGSPAVRMYFTAMNSLSSPPPVLALRADSVWSAGPWALEQGRWSFTFPAGAKVPPGAFPMDSGKYMARWVQENGKWLIVQDIWNSDLAYVPALPAPPTHK